jgi:hypothetical protein
LRLANLPNFALGRLDRYEATLWRPAGQILFSVDALDRGKPQQRICRFRNRRNALRGTGPKTESGKHISRCNAVRHGVTADTVIRALEDAEDYKAFEAAITADYDAQSAVERELVLRLASVLWRLRRATIMETGKLEIQAEHLRDYRQARQLPARQGVIHAVFGCASVGGDDSTADIKTVPTSDVPPAVPIIELARCFLRLANLPNFALYRLSQYEAALWRQARQILFALEALDRRKPQERKIALIGD